MSIKEFKENNEITRNTTILLEIIVYKHINPTHFVLQLILSIVWNLFIRMMHLTKTKSFHPYSNIYIKFASTTIKLLPLLPLSPSLSLSLSPLSLSCRYGTVSSFFPQEKLNNEESAWWFSPIVCLTFCNLTLNENNLLLVYGMMQKYTYCISHFELRYMQMIDGLHTRIIIQVN